MLLESHRHAPSDLRLWASFFEGDLTHARSESFARRVESAASLIREFSAAPCFVGVSWGKDSVVVASLAAAVAPAVPLVWLRIEPIANPDCVLVRDEFLRRHPQAVYHEIVRDCPKSGCDWRATGTLESAADEAHERFGGRRITGIRASESRQRKLSAAVHGCSTIRSCRPLLRWSAADVFAYLASRGEPVHPAYGCLGGGRYSRERIRVSSLGGQRGRGLDRGSWEWEYYGTELRRLASVAR